MSTKFVAGTTSQPRKKQKRTGKHRFTRLIDQLIFGGHGGGEGGGGREEGGGGVTDVLEHHVHVPTHTQRPEVTVLVDSVELHKSTNLLFQYIPVCSADWLTMRVRLS